MMSTPAVALLTSAVAAGTRVLPDYAGGSIVNVAASILAAFDIEPPSPPLRPEFVDPEVLRSAPGGIVCLVIDGLGWAQLQSGLDCGRVPHFQHLVDTASAPARLTSVFPSTTVSALTSLATAHPPAGHGILGHVMWLPQVGAACNILHFAPVGRSEAPFDDDLLRCQPTIHQQLTAAGIPSSAITAAAYEGTAFTNLLQRGSQFLGYQAQSQIPVLLEQALSTATGNRGFVCMYWPHIDTIGHITGPDLPATPSPASAMELEFVDLMVGHVANVCRRHDCTLLITADHGQTRLDPERTCVLAADVLARFRQRPGGGRRVAYLATDDAEYLRTCVIADAATVLPMDDVVDAGWFGGALSDAFRARIGDWLAVADDGVQFLIDDGHGLFPQQGSHAGLTPEEMEVPLFVVPAS